LAVAAMFAVTLMAWAADPAPKPADKAKAADPSQMKVTVTESGKSYHTADCSAIKSSTAKKEVPLADATNQGLTPCSKCNPPVEVFTTAGGEKYHKTTSCIAFKGKGDKTPVGMLLDDAKSKKLTPCAKCYPPEKKAADAGADADAGKAKPGPAK
jgi:hypothetical protein